MIRARERNRSRKRRRLKKDDDFQNDVVQALPPDPKAVEVPEDLIFAEILTRLPVNFLTQFKLVSKTWNSIISSPNFIKSHLKCTNTNPFVPSNCVFIRSSYFFYILNYAAYDRCPNDNRGEKGLISVKNLSFYDNGVSTFLIGSCNGLVCFGRGNTNTMVDFYVYNPVMGHCCHVLDPLGNFEGKLIFGFGFVSSKDDYILFVGGLQKRSSESFVYIYSLKSREWKKIGAFDEGVFAIFWGGRGVLVNETLHWDMTQVWTSSVKSICGFDLVDETFKDVRIPEIYVGNGNNLTFRLCEMGGSLCAWIEDINGGVEMWMLMQYGAWDSWMKLFKINMIPGLSNFYGCTENGKVLVQTDEGSLLLADPNQSPAKYTSLVEDLGDIEVVSYVRSLVSPFL